MVSIAKQGYEYVCMILTVLGEGRGRMGSNVSVGVLTSLNLSPKWLLA